jgi:protease II
MIFYTTFFIFMHLLICNQPKSKKMKSVFFILLGLLWCLDSVAQELILKGKIVYASNNQPVPFAYVQVKNVALGTVSDQNGNFSLKIPEFYQGSVLAFSYMGCKTQELVIAQISQPDKMLIKLEESIKQLKEIVIQNKRRETNPRKVLNRVIGKITQNYSQNYVYLDAYARESLKENGSYIQYADAACRFYYGAYEGKSYHLNDYLLARKKENITFNILHLNLGTWSERLHDHFSNSLINNTLATDKLAIIQARASENLSQENLNAKIEGGPLTIISKDIMRYLNWFLNKKEFKRYIYKLENIRNAEGQEFLLLSFSPKKAPATDAEISAQLAKNKRISRTDILSGQLYIDPDTYAVSRVSFYVSPEYKKLICNIRNGGIQHFGYEISLDYQQINQKWYLKKIYRRDEFLREDTIRKQVIPYNAISELFVNQVINENVKPLTGDFIYNSINALELMESPLEFDKTFWDNYTKINPLALISDSIRSDMEKIKPLEKQFLSRTVKDTTLKAPVAKQIPQTLKMFGQTFTDNYAWLKDPTNARNNPEVMSYLQAENKFTENYSIPLKRSQRAIYNQLLANFEKTSESLPFYENGYYYITRYQEDQEYPIIYRTKDSTSQKESWEILFDVNQMAEGQDFYSLTNFSISPDNQLIAYSVNTTGGGDNTFYFKNLSTQQLLSDSLQNIGNLVWLKDNKTLYYTQLHPQSYRSYRVMKHTLGTPVSADVPIYEEADERFNVNLYTSPKKEMVFMAIDSRDASEVYFKRADKIDEAFQLIQKREENHQYNVNYFKDKFLIMSNKDAINVRIMEADIDKPNFKNWRELIPHQPNVLIQSFQRFDNFWLIQEKQNAQTRLKVIDIKSQKSHFIEFSDEIYTCGIGYNPQSDTEVARIIYSSPTDPQTIYDYNMATKTKKVVKIQKAAFFSLPKYYKTERVFATAKDGSKIPITLFYNKMRVKKDGSNKLWLTGYGAYGISMEATYSKTVFSILNQGFIYAIAHVRGGSDCGFDWYEQGRLLNKQNTFTDFIACAEYLIAEKYTSPDRVVAQGGSAGGLLMGAVVNARPDLFHTVVLDVPFVDVINTMLDEKLPLTTGEYYEWGNPKEKKYFEYMRQYSPYDNVKAQNYPNLLFFTALNDKNVGYWEAAKMVAKLRALKTDNNTLLLHCNMTGGHGGSSGRYNNLRELAFQYSIIFDLLDDNKLAKITINDK